ncbi:MAG: tyrosine-protein phosphatase [Dehalococcoidia bacterium]|nr:tyrosine-protein phosphatase [Dehalococcoidia bacterium]
MENMPAVPFPRSYWVLPGKLLAGCYPGDKDVQLAQDKLTGLVQCGIRRAISLMEEGEVDHKGRAFVPYAADLTRLAGQLGSRVECVRMPIRDTRVPTREEMRSILDTIDGAIGENLPVFVHCWGGKGRTGTVVGCYLARHGLEAGDQALFRIQELRRNDPTCHEPSPENELQREMVRSWNVGE